MNIHAKPNIKTGISVCPHDCPSACALEVELLDENTIGRVRGAKENSYTLGVICEKVARYSERIHHPERLLYPLKRVGPKGSGSFARITWDEAMDEIARRFLAIEQEHGSEAVWPYWYAGTMGFVMRDGIDRLTHVKNYSRMYGTFCIALSWPGFAAGTGAIRGVDPREMQKSDLIVVWGGNPVNTQVNVMTHVGIARKTRGAKLAVIDVYETGTMKQADHGYIVRPGTDGALACAVMHILFRDAHADRDYMHRYTDDPAGLEAHLATKTPEWAAAITGLSVEKIEELARLIGTTKRTFFRIGYGFSRSRNGSANMHAVTCIPAVTGAWQYEGGGALHSNSGMYKWNKAMITGRDAAKPGIRTLDQSRIGEVLCGNPHDLQGGPPVKALFIQNTNPVSVAPDQNRVKQGFAREDLFTVVHEQFLTETARYADIVLPATMFLEHDDIYQGGGHSHIMFGRKLVNPPGECRSNHDVLCDLAGRLGAEHEGFRMSPRELIDRTLKDSKRRGFDELDAENWFDVQPDFETSHFLNGFAHPDGKFHFRADWKRAASVVSTMGALGPWQDMPVLPDHWAVTEPANAETPFRMTTSPARTFLNSSFNETPGSRKREGGPSLLIHPDDLSALGASAGDRLRVGNARGEVILEARANAGQQRGVVVAEGIWKNDDHETGCGINSLTGADQPAPAGGGAFHDTAVWVKRA
ncbi:molybdopterin oxidoreductase family protein [Aestuariivirga sp.]|uniref:molybdopterin oxidoreductase family protein n=1 Tax=Aestuariivirga sp. TaxID=2650926 RepID=UPI0039E6BE83